MTEKKIVSLQEYKIRQQRRILPILKYLMRKTSLLLTILPLLLCESLVFGQISKGNFDQIKLGNFNPGYEQNVNRWNEVNEDTLKGTSKMEVPEGIYVWNIDPLFGDITPTQLDTLMHDFQNEGSTRGKRGGYLVTGNLGSPRHSLRLQNEEPTHWHEQFIFMNPYDFFVQRPFGQVFTNTKSPFTNITYHECGDKEHGEDRITALFAVNAGKRLGMGFNVDYLYGRGYFQSQNTAHFMGNLYASYMGERYKAHIAYRLHHLKTSENGGIEDDRYITEPEAFTNSYETWDMPTALSKTWNKLNVNSLLFTQRIDLGSNVQKVDTLKADSLRIGTTTSEHLGVAPMSITHSLQIDHDDRLFLSNFKTNEHNAHYFKDFFFAGDSAKDKTKHFAVRNTIALELNEKWKTWLRAGARLYLSHKYERFGLPKSVTTFDTYAYNYYNVGLQLMHRKGKNLDYDMLGELRTRDGKRWGEFTLMANGGLHTNLGNDTLSVDVFGKFSSEEPAFYYRHYQSRNAWWDEEGMSNTLTTQLGATLRYKTTRLSVRFEQQNKGTYFQETLFDQPNADAANLKLHRVNAIQNGKPVQRLEVALYHLQTWGIINWENEFTYQTTSDKSLSPAPTFLAYSNLYLKFKIAKVLNTEIGSDVRFFTRYTPQIYSPIIGQYVLQDSEKAEKIGGYPIVNIYANMHLKRTRFYIMASHINSSDRQKKAFELPHYPMNGFTMHLGISWNFIN